MSCFTLLPSLDEHCCWTRASYQVQSAFLHNNSINKLIPVEMYKVRHQGQRHIRPGGHAHLARNVHPQTAQQFDLQSVRCIPKGRVVEHLESPNEALGGGVEFILEDRFVGVFHEGDVVEPEPVGRNSVAVDEEAAEEEEVAEDGDDDRVSNNDVRDHAGEERYEGASGPEGGEDHEKVEEEPRDAPAEAHPKEGGAAIGIIGGFAHENVAFMKEHWEVLAELKKVVAMATAKKPKRSWTPLEVLSRRQNKVARMKPVTIAEPRRTPKSSGILRELVIVRLDSITISIQKELAKV
ncbi:ABC-2 type transporter family protein [Actinidia rufa]|uniref:ABC-2 type transporter family protein n=1 Tax=Actinidia rufa TaxID=165716 RepID=A0A7J0GVS8_9ERIC|nr:ABC-2 type transporter family protein [Actinidia rufa]